MSPKEAYIRLIAREEAAKAVVKADRDHRLHKAEEESFGQRSKVSRLERQNSELRVQIETLVGEIEEMRAEVARLESPDA